MCVSTSSVRYDFAGRSLIAHVPCGHCYECVRKRKLDWEMRLTVESSVSAHTFFGMLTYSDEFYHNDVQTKEIQYYFKRLRYNLNSFYPGAKLKYYLVSELGELKDRLHYHVLYFVSKEFDDTHREFEELCKLSWVKKVPLTPEEVTFRKRVYYNVKKRNLYKPERLKEIYNWSRRKYDDISIGFATCRALKHGTAVGSIHYACKYIQKQYNKMYYSRVGYKAWRDYMVKEGLLVSNWDKSKDFFNGNPCAGKLFTYTGKEYPTFPIRGKRYPVPKVWCLNTFGKYLTRLLRSKLADNFKDEHRVDYNRQFAFEYKEPERMKYVSQRYTEMLLARRESARMRDDFIQNEDEWHPISTPKPLSPCQGVLELTFPTVTRLRRKWDS